MTLDELAEVATDLAVAARRPGSNAARCRPRLHRARRRRTAVVSLAAAAVLAVTVAGVGAAVGRDGATPSPAAGGQRKARRPLLGPRITCLPGGGVRVALDDPVVLVAPANFETTPRSSPVATADLPNRHRERTGITVLERAVPVRNDQSRSRDPAAGSAPHSVATWVAHRPFLRRTTPERVQVGGRTAWRVPTVLRNGSALKATFSDGAVAPMFTSLGSRAYVSPSLPGEITVLASPSGHGIIAIWSWTTTGQTYVLAGNQAMVAGLRFP